MNSFLKTILPLLAIGLLCGGCSKQDEIKNQTAKQILSSHCADMVQSSFLDQNPESTRFLATPEALAEFLAIGQSVEDEPWKSLLNGSLLSADTVKELPWTNQDLQVNTNFEFYGVHVPSASRGSAMNLLDSQLPQIALDASGNLSEIMDLRSYERLQGLAAAAGADFVESALKFDDAGMLIADNRIANLRDAIVQKPFVNHVLLACHCEMMRLQLWGWAVTQGLLSEKMLTEKSFQKRLPEYRMLLRHAFIYELLQCELIIDAYSKDPEGTAKLFSPGVLKKLPEKINISEELYPKFIDQRLKLANLLNILANSDSPVEQTIAAKAYLLEMTQNPLFVRQKTPLNTFSSIVSGLDTAENAAELLSIAFDIARYRNIHGSLPENLNRLIPDYCISLPESSDAKQPEWLPESGDSGTRRFKLSYPSAQKNLTLFFDSGKQQ